MDHKSLSVYSSYTLHMDTLMAYSQYQETKSNPMEIFRPRHQKYQTHQLFPHLPRPKSIFYKDMIKTGYFGKDPPLWTTLDLTAHELFRSISHKSYPLPMMNLYKFQDSEGMISLDTRFKTGFFQAYTDIKGIAVTTSLQSRAILDPQSHTIKLANTTFNLLMTSIKISLTIKLDNRGSDIQKSEQTLFEFQNGQQDTSVYTNCYISTENERMIHFKIVKNLIDKPHLQKEFTIPWIHLGDAHKLLFRISTSSSSLCGLDYESEDE